ncbi:MAG: prepilin peptidase [Ignavibacteria bacterium]|nr:prepilin peptidase [Ignavibacteria bacterium]
MTQAFIILLSLALGSFSNNVISFFWGSSPFDVKRSLCMCGERELKAKELIPVLSFMMQKGKCINCRKAIPNRYVIVEILSLFIGIITYYTYGLTVNMALHYAFFMTLFIIGMVDLKKLIIPNMFVIIILMLAVVKVVLYGEVYWINIISAVSLGSLFMLVNYLGSMLKGKNLIGPGDIKLIMVMTLFMDFPVSLLALWISALIAIPGYYTIRQFNNELKLKTLVPFGFFMAIGYSFTELFSFYIFKLAFSLRF